MDGIGFIFENLDYIAGILELVGIYLVVKKLWIGHVMHLFSSVLWTVIGINNPEVRGLLVICIPAIVLRTWALFLWRGWKDEEN